MTKPSVAGMAPFGALVLMVVATAALGAGAEELVPWLVAAASGLLAVCCLGIVAAHVPPPPRLALGGWVSAFGFGALAGAQVLLAVGEPIDLDDPSGPMAQLAPLLLGTAIVTLPIATGVLALSTGRAGRMPGWGVAALWTVTPLPPLLLLGGASLGPLLPVALVLLMVGWVVVGLALRAIAQ